MGFASGHEFVLRIRIEMLTREELGNNILVQPAILRPAHGSYKIAIEQQLDRMRPLISQ